MIGDYTGLAGSLLGDALSGNQGLGSMYISGSHLGGYHQQLAMAQRNAQQQWPVSRIETPRNVAKKKKSLSSLLGMNKRPRNGLTPNPVFGRDNHDSILGYISKEYFDKHLAPLMDGTRYRDWVKTIAIEAGHFAQ